MGLQHPLGVDVNQWASLVAYWSEQETKKKTNQLTDTRGVVMNVSKYGHEGRAEVKTKLVCHFQPSFFNLWFSVYIVANFL